MNNRLLKWLPVLFIVLALGSLAVPSYFEYRSKKAKSARLAALLPSPVAPPVKPFHLDERIKSANCRARGALPDHDCTPGAVFADADAKHICISGYSKTVRNVSTKLRKAVYAAYGVSYPQLRGAYEVDHLIPLALGGSNDIANLFLEAAEPQPGFREKDLVEIFLQNEVCAGRVALGAAQEQIASDWLAVYNNLTPEQIKNLRQKFKNWAQ